MASSRPPRPVSSSTHSALALGEGQEGRGGGDLEEGDRQPGIRRLAALQAARQPLLGDRRAVDQDALVEGHQMGRDVAVDPAAGRLQHGRQHGQRAALAVGAGDVDHRRQPPLGMAQGRQQALDPAEREIDALGVERVQAGQDQVTGAARHAPHPHEPRRAGWRRRHLPGRHLGDHPGIGRPVRPLQQVEQPRQRRAHLEAVHHLVDHAVRQQILGALEAFGQLLADGLLDHPRPREADHRPGLGQMDVADHGEGRGDAARGRVGQDHDVGQARLLDLLHRHRGPCHLHQGQRALLHPRPARGGHHDEGRVVAHRMARGGDETLAQAGAHRAAHELEVHHRDHGRQAADPAEGRLQRVGGLGLGLGLAQTVGVFLLVAEAQRVGRAARHLQPLPATLVEQGFEPVVGPDPHMVVTMRADALVGVEVAVEDHPLAGRALLPEILRHLGLVARIEGADLRPDIVGEPAHRAAPRTASARARTLACRAGTRAGVARPCASRFLARRSIRAEPTTAASAMRAISAACSGSRMPKPTATGSRVCRLMRATSGRHPLGHGRLLAGDAGDRDVVDEARDVLEHRRQALVVGGGRRQPDEVEAGRARRQAELGVLLRRQVDHDQPVGTGGLGVRQEALVAVAVDRVVVAHQHDRHVGVGRAHPPDQLQRRGHARPGRERPQARRLDRRPVGHRIGERHADLDQVGTGGRQARRSARRRWRSRDRPRSGR